MTNNYTLERARDFAENNQVDRKFYPKFNFAAPVGWMNDPNGVSIYKDELHLFYQYYPYDSVHGKMHWGHTKTKDGINWEHLDVALAPDQPYDKDGVFSGSAIEKDGKLYLMYTGHVVIPNGEIRENQSIAISEDGVNFEKYEKNPVIDSEDVPEGSSIIDFRDPKVFERNGKYYTVIGSKTVDNKGQVLLYESDDLLNWEYKSVILPYNEYLGDMVECPDLILFEEKDAFLLSAMNYTDKESGVYYPHISWLIEGKVDWDTYVFEVESVRKMDGGFDFYAPQTTLSSTSPNEYTAIAWQQAWNRTLPSHDARHKWSGQMTIPRLLKVENNKIKQYPYPEITSNIIIEDTHKKIELEDSCNFDFQEEFISFSMNNTEQVRLTLLNQDNESIEVNFDAKNQRVEFSRKNTIEIIDSNNKVFNEIRDSVFLNEDIWNIQMFVDVSSIQIFINNDYTLTSTYYSNAPLDVLKFESDSNSIIRELQVGNLNIKGGE